MKLTAGTSSLEVDPFAINHNTERRDSIQPGLYERTGMGWDVETPTTTEPSMMSKRPRSLEAVRVNESFRQHGERLIRTLGRVVPTQQVNLLTHRIDATGLSGKLHLPGGVEFEHGTDSSLLVIPVDGGVAFAAENILPTVIDISTNREDRFAQYVLRISIGEVVEIDSAQSYFDRNKELQKTRQANYESRSRELTEVYAGADGTRTYRDGHGNMHVVEPDGSRWCSYTAADGLSYIGPNDSVGFYLP